MIFFELSIGNRGDDRQPLFACPARHNSTIIWPWSKDRRIMNKTIEGITSYHLGIIELLLGATLISFSPVFVKLARLGPTAAGFYRNLFGALFLLAIVMVRRESLWRGRRPFGFAVACALLFAADLSFWHRSIIHIGPGLATIMGNLQIFFLAVFGIVVFRERIDWRFLISLPLAIIGLYLLVGVDWGRLGANYRTGVLFGLFTAVTYAAYVLVLQRSRSLSSPLSAVANLAVISSLAAAVMGIETIVVGETFYLPDAQTWWSMLAYGILCQALGWIIISRALTR